MSHTVHSVSIKELTQNHPEIENSGLIMPQPGVLIKGGGARSYLRFHANSPHEQIEKEIPPTDFDYIVTDPSALPRHVAATGDIIGLEFKPGKTPEDSVTQADVNMNACVVTHDRLVYTQSAFEGAQTGIVDSNYHNRRGYFGDDFFVKDGIVYPQPSSVFRLMKLVAEGRAAGLKWPVNCPSELADKWLEVYRRYRGRPDFIQIGQNFFNLAKQMNIPTYGKNFMESVMKMHEEHPHYPLTSSGPKDPSFYLVSKLVSHVHEYLLPREDIKPNEVRLPDTQTIVLPDENETDVVKITFQHEEFENKLAQNQSKKN